MVFSVQTYDLCSVVNTIMVFEIYKWEHSIVMIILQIVFFNKLLEMKVPSVKFVRTLCEHGSHLEAEKKALSLA